MTREKFIEDLQAYYDGPLPKTARVMTLSYLKEYDEKNLPTLFGIVLKYHPINYGTPAIATIEKAHFAYMIGDEKNKIDGHSSLKAVKGFSPCRYVAPDGPPISDEEKKAILDEAEAEGKEFPGWFKEIITKEEKEEDHHETA